jgi:hypothetical protein
MAAFEDPSFLLLGFLAQACLLGLAPLDPASLPMDLVDVDNRKARAFAERLSKRAFAGSGLANDHDPPHHAKPSVYDRRSRASTRSREHRSDEYAA